MWNIEKIVSKGDYNYVIVRDHPNATSNGYVLEHRVVMENYLGRVLLGEEIIHHINHIKKDNRLENLLVMTQEEHGALHARRGRTFLPVECNYCSIMFQKEKRQIKVGQTKFFCTKEHYWSSLR